MFNYYKLDIIPIILERFKVKTIISTGIIDEETFKFILDFCDANNSSNFASDSKNTLNELSQFENYEAIFLNDDPNWYTVYNELNMIKQQNKEFPLVFICNNVFPHKKRDSYHDPDKIPKEFRNEYSREFKYGDMTFRDDLFHASQENTPKNGVLTAIDDFLNENSSISIMEIKFLNGITILYPNNSISQIRLGLLFDDIEEYALDWDLISDSIWENKLLNNYIQRFNLTKESASIIEDFKVELSEKEKVLSDYEHKIKLNDAELSLKDSQINSFNSKLDFKNLEIKNAESKLVNRENEISNLKNEINQKKHRENELNAQIKQINDKLNAQEKDISIKQKELNDKDLTLNSIKQQYIDQLSKWDEKEYCICCYKEKIDNDQLEIQYLKNDSVIKKLLNPFSYLYLIFKSNPKELSINLKLYKAIKNSKCFDIGYYLNNNKDLLGSKWCKYFSPELHYVCNGFSESRKFNKKYFNRNSKEELLNYILNC